MLFTYVHRKEYANVSQDIAHLYEHLVIYSFQLHLKSLGIYPGLIGSISGETFEQVIFLNATFYDQRVADAYKHFLIAPQSVDAALIPQMLAECEVEDGVTFEIQDKDEMNVQLNSLVAMSWVDNDFAVSHFIDETKVPEVALNTKRTAKEFRDISLGFYFESEALDQDEETLFLRLSVIIEDIVNFGIREKVHGMYHMGRAPISIYNDAMIGGMHLRFKKDVSLRLIKEVAESVLTSFDMVSAVPFIMAQFKEFADRATWKNSVIDYYRHTGMVTSNAYIASLATPERIASIMSKIRIHVRAMDKGDDEWFS
jgi:hypothetical protein